MIKETRYSDSPESLPSLRLDKAVAGDTFAQVIYRHLQSGVDVRRYTVERVLKRDVVCRDQKGREKRFNLNFEVHQAFSAEADPQLQEIIQKETLRQLRVRVAEIAGRISQSLGDAIDDELIKALLAYDKRCEARSRPAPSA